MVNIPSQSYSSEQIRRAYTVLALCTFNAEFNKRPKSSIRHAWLDPISEHFFFFAKRPIGTDVSHTHGHY